MKRLAGRFIERALWLSVVLMSVSCDGGGDRVEPRAFAIEVLRTGQTTSHRAGDDGATQRGAEWPIPRFTNPDGTLPIGGGVVLDRLTGLFWPSDANAPGPTACGPSRRMDWTAALEYVRCLNTSGYLGFSDWHLPNKTELSSLLNYEPSDYQGWMSSQGFSNVQTGYWSSTTRAGDSSIDQYRWVVSMASTYYSSSRSEESVWPVRGSTPALPRTGQTRTYAPGDDGDLQIGAAWPDPRFSSSEGSSGVLLDELTGLRWAQDANAPGPSACNPGAQMSWQDAFAYVDCLNANNYLGHSDWLLPNINDLESVLIADRSLGPSYWLNSQGFRNVQAARCYWSSTTVSAATNPFAWCIAMVDGSRAVAEKGQAIVHFVWPMRRRQ